MSDIKEYTHLEEDEFCDGTKAAIFLTPKQVEILKPFVDAVLKADANKGVCLSLAQVVYRNAFEGVVRIRIFEGDQGRRVYDGISAVLKSEGIE